MAVYLPIVSEFKDGGIKAAIKEFRTLETAGQKAQFALRKAALPAAAALGGLAVAGKAAVDSASDLAESQSKVAVIFGDSADAVNKFAETAAQSLGQSKQDVLNAAGVFGTFGKAAGLTGDDLATFSNDFTALASDLASFNNTTPQEAIDAIGAALRGESEPLRRYGVLLDDATLKAAALELGISNGKDTLTAQQKVLAAQSVIFKQTTAAQGDFARTSGGLANQQRILKANLANTTATIGQAFLPLVQTLLPVLQKLANFFAENTDLLIGLAVAVGALAAVILTANGAMAAWNAITAITAAVNAVLGASFSALWVATGVGVIVAVIAALAVLQAKFDIFGRLIRGLRTVFSGLWDGIKTGFRLTVDAVKGYANLWLRIFGTVYNAIADGWNSTIGALKVPDWVPVFGGKGVPDLPNWSVPQLADGGVVSSATLALIGEAGPEAVVPLDRLSTGGTVINVQGALDPVSVARQIRDLLNADARRNGRVVIL